MPKHISKGKLSHIQHVMLDHVRKYIDHKAKLVGGSAIRYRIWNGKDHFYKFGRKIKQLDMKHLSLDEQIKIFGEVYDV